MPEPTYPRTIAIPSGPSFELLSRDAAGVHWRSGDEQGTAADDEVAIYAATFVYVRRQLQASMAATHEDLVREAEELRERVAELELENDQLRKRATG